MTNAVTKRVCFWKFYREFPIIAERGRTERNRRWLLSGAYEQGCKYAKGPPFKAEGVYLTPAKASAVRHEANRSGNTGNTRLL